MLILNFLYGSTCCVQWWWRLVIHCSSSRTRLRQGLPLASHQNNWACTQLQHQVCTFSSHPVCKMMFLNTTAIGEWSVRNWTFTFPVEKQQRVSPYYDRRSDDKEFMRKEFLDKLPILPSHYCRKATSKMYLEPSRGGSRIFERGGGGPD